MPRIKKSESAGVRAAISQISPAEVQEAVEYIYSNEEKEGVFNSFATMLWGPVILIALIINRGATNPTMLIVEIGAIYVLCLIALWFISRPFKQRLRREMREFAQRDPTLYTAAKIRFEEITFPT